MRYDQTLWKDGVEYYKLKLKPHKKKKVFIYGDFNKSSFLSFAPLSKAASELGIDLHISMNSSSSAVLKDVWKTYEDYKNKKKTEAAAALGELFSKIDIPELEKYFNRPDLILKISPKGFSGTISLENKDKWFVTFEQKKLKKTTDQIIKEVFALKRSETFSIGFVLLPKRLQHTLQDYLDSYAICLNMYSSSKGKAKKVVIKAATQRNGLRDLPERISELMTTLLGMELEKDIDLPVFKAYKKLSNLLDLKRLEVAQATFFVSSKGYHGKHIFGEKKGYPTKNLKTRWTSPGGMVYKFHWYPQSELEDRPPRSRVSFTSTVPLENFIDSTLIDYKLMRGRNKEIGTRLQGCDKVIVKSHIKGGSDFVVGLKKKDGTRRRILYSDSDTRHIINPRIKKETGKDMGMMANIPGGEAFTTPSQVVGRIVGDIVINIDKSRKLSPKKPFVVVSTKAGYKLVSAPKLVKEVFIKKKKEAWKNILEQEKNRSLPKELIALKKKNFNKIGEFAINTNPNAKLCEYLIINEKIANMIHVAFGSGFEPDTATEYHMDVVIDAPRQKMDIYGVDKDRKKHWIMEKGKFVI